MRSKTLATVLVGAVVLIVSGGCTKSADGQLPTPEMISEALPTITDMPGTWDETQRQVFQTREPENPSIDPSVWCPDSDMVTKNLVELAGGSGADVEMQDRTDSGSIRMMRLQAWANDDVEAYFRDAREAARICDDAEVTVEPGVTETYSVIEARDIGDESISWIQSTSPPPATQGDKLEVIGRTTIARFGSIIMVLQIGDAAFTGETTAMDEDDWWAIVEMVGRRLDELDSQVHD